MKVLRFNTAVKVVMCEKIQLFYFIWKQATRASLKICLKTKYGLTFPMSSKFRKVLNQIHH